MVQRLYRILIGTAIAVLGAGAIAPASAQPTHVHAAQHGGILLPINGNTLHVEAAWPAPRIVRVFVSDEMMRQVSQEQLHGINGQVVVGSETFPLRQSPEGFLEAQIPEQSVPAQLTLRLTLPPGGDEKQFALTFRDQSVDSGVVDFMLPPTPIPPTMEGIVAALREDGRDARATVSGRDLVFAYAPAARARDHLLALEPHVAMLAPAAQPRAAAAILAAVRAAWLLHTASDAGLSPFQTAGAVDILVDALEDVVSAFGPSR